MANNALEQALNNKSSERKSIRNRELSDNSDRKNYSLPCFTLFILNDTLKPSTLLAIEISLTFYGFIFITFVQQY